MKARFKRHPILLPLTHAAVTAIILGAVFFSQLGALILPGIVVLFFAIVGWGVVLNNQTLANSPSGTVRIENVPASRANLRLQSYTDAGWSLVNQSSAKSLGRQTQVTLTFRKN